MTFDDLPIIQCKRGPTDAQLAAERDAQHAQAVAAFDDEERRIAEMRSFDVFRGFDHIPPRAVQG